MDDHKSTRRTNKKHDVVSLMDRGVIRRRDTQADVVEIAGRLTALLGEQAYPHGVKGVWGKMVAEARYRRSPDWIGRCSIWISYFRSLERYDHGSRRFEPFGARPLSEGNSLRIHNLFENPPADPDRLARSHGGIDPQSTSA